MAEADQQVLWAPQPGPQTALLECPVFEVFYGGARGGGKTESSIGDWLQHSSIYGEHAIGIFFRRTRKQLSEVVARTRQIFPKLGAKWNDRDSVWTMANGARLKFAYLERDRDAEEYQGHSYTRVYVEEVTNFPSPRPIDLLRATLRSGAGVAIGMRLTGNPGGPGHNWVKARYIDPCPAGYKVIRESTTLMIDGVEKEIMLERVFIPSRLGDNQLLMQNDPAYVLRLRQVGSEALVRAWLTGDWNIVDGAFFNEFSEESHILPASKFLQLLNPGMTIFRSFDWGSAKPFSCGWYAMLDREYHFEGKVLPYMALVKFQEWYGASAPNVGLKMTADLVAKGIVEREKGLRVRYGVADPAIFIRDGGPSIAETMAVHRVTWRRADNKRKTGWEQLRQRLTGQLGVPMLYFTDACEDTIRTLPTLQHDDRDSEDLDTEAEDHAADETRYAVMSRPWLPRVSALRPDRRLDPSKMTFKDVMDLQRRKRKEAEGVI